MRPYMSTPEADQAWRAMQTRAMHAIGRIWRRRERGSYRVPIWTGSPADERELLTYASRLTDAELLLERNIGIATLEWIRRRQEMLLGVGAPRASRSEEIAEAMRVLSEAHTRVAAILDRVLEP
jgi:hypothetical protein